MLKTLLVGFALVAGCMSAADVAALDRQREIDDFRLYLGGLRLEEL